MATLEEQLQALYQENLGRTAGEAGLQFYLGELASGGKTMDEIAADLAWAAENSPVETTATTARGLWAAEDPVDSYANIGKYTLEDLYREELGRTNISDTALEHYQNKIAQGYSPAQIRAELNASAEGQAYDEAAEGKAINTMTGAIISGTDEEYQDYVDQFGTGTIVTDGYTDIKRMYPNASYPLDMLDADTVNALREEYGQELLTSSPNDLWSGFETATTTQPTYESNYGQYGKLPNETLTDYYSRLSTEREGGVLGQGLLSAEPTVGSAAWDAMQLAGVELNPNTTIDASGRVNSSSSGGDPFAVNTLSEEEKYAQMRFLQENPMARKALQSLLPYGLGSLFFSEDAVNNQVWNNQNEATTGTGFWQTLTRQNGDVVSAGGDYINPTTGQPYDYTTGSGSLITGEATSEADLRAEAAKDDYFQSLMNE